MKFTESEKALRPGDVLNVDKLTNDPKEIGEALLEEKNVVGVFRNPELCNGAPCFRVYRVKNGILYIMILLPDRVLHLMELHALQDEAYKNSVPKQILAENEKVFFDEANHIDVRKAHVPDSPNADQIRKMLKA